MQFHWSEVAALLTGSGEGLIDRANIHARVRLLPVGHRDQPHHRHVRVQLFGSRLSQCERVHVPLSSLQEEPADIATVFWPRGQLRGMLFHNLGARER